MQFGALFDVTCSMYSKGYYYNNHKIVYEAFIFPRGLPLQYLQLNLVLASSKTLRVVYFLIAELKKNLKVMFINLAVS